MDEYGVHMESSPDMQGFTYVESWGPEGYDVVVAERDRFKATLEHIKRDASWLSQYSIMKIATEGLTGEPFYKGGTLV
jgi:hypothetical protein